LIGGIYFDIGSLALKMTEHLLISSTASSTGQEGKTMQTIDVEVEELEPRWAPSIAPGLHGNEGQPGNQGGGGGNGLGGYEGQPGNQGG
jgi:hypothetical protein